MDGRMQHLRAMALLDLERVDEALGWARKRCGVTAKACPRGIRPGARSLHAQRSPGRHGTGGRGAEAAQPAVDLDRRRMATPIRIQPGAGCAG